MDMSTIVPGNAICDTQDRPIAITGVSAYRAATATTDAVRDAIGYHASYIPGKEAYHLVPDNRFNQKPLTIPERAVIAAFAGHFAKFTTGIERDRVINFPKVITPPDCDVYDSNAVGFASEARAYRFADVVQHTFCLDAMVVETPAGGRWLVAVSAPGGIDAATLEQLSGACRLAEEYRLEPTADTPDANPATQSPVHPDNAFHGPLTRIEAALTQIIDRLTPNVTTAPEAPTTPTEKPEHRRGDTSFSTANKSAKRSKSA